MELSEELIRSLSEMKFCAEAERRVSYMPLASLYWTDEISESIDDLFEDGNEARLAPLLRLFAIRGALWTGTEVSEADRAFWQMARAQIPDYALFARLEVTEEEVAMYREIAQASRGFWHTFFDVEDSADANAEAADAESVELSTQMHEDVELLSEFDIVQTPPPGE